MKALLAPRTGGLLALALVIALLPAMLPNNFYFNVAILVGLNAIVCIGLNLLIGYAGQISLGHAGFFGLGAYASALLTSNYGWPSLAALVVGAAGVGVLAFLLARPILKLKAESRTAPVAVPIVPTAFGSPDRLAEPVTCSAMSDETVTTPI